MTSHRFFWLEADDVGSANVAHNEEFKLTGYFDNDWGGSSDDYRSIYNRLGFHSLIWCSCVVFEEATNNSSIKH